MLTETHPAMEPQSAPETTPEPLPDRHVRKPKLTPTVRALILLIAEWNDEAEACNKVRTRTALHLRTIAERMDRLSDRVREMSRQARREADAAYPREAPHVRPVVRMIGGVA